MSRHSQASRLSSLVGSARVSSSARRSSPRPRAARPSWRWFSSSSGLSFVAGLVTSFLLAWFAEGAVADAQRLVARERALLDGMLPHRVANLVARGVSDLL